MTDPKEASDDEVAAWHRHFAVGAFNQSWDRLEQTDRTPEDDADLLALAFASRWHWSNIGNEENAMTGDHQIAKAAAAVGLADLSLRYAQRALDACTANGWTDWRQAAAFEGMARAHHAAADKIGRDQWLRKAAAALEILDDPEDRQVIEDQLRELPGWPPA